MCKHNFPFDNTVSFIHLFCRSRPVKFAKSDAWFDFSGGQCYNKVLSFFIGGAGYAAGGQSAAHGLGVSGDPGQQLAGRHVFRDLGRLEVDLGLYQALPAGGVVLYHPGRGQLHPGPGVRRGQQILHRHHHRLRQRPPVVHRHRDGGLGPGGPAAAQRHLPHFHENIPPGEQRYPGPGVRPPAGGRLAVPERVCQRRPAQPPVHRRGLRILQRHPLAAGPDRHGLHLRRHPGGDPAL